MHKVHSCYSCSVVCQCVSVGARNHVLGWDLDCPIGRALGVSGPLKGIEIVRSATTAIYCIQLYIALAIGNL